MRLIGEKEMDGNGNNKDVMFRTCREQSAHAGDSHTRRESTWTSRAVDLDIPPSPEDKAAICSHIDQA